MAQTFTKRAIAAASVSLIALAGAVFGAAVVATAEAQDNRTPALTGGVAPVVAPVSFADLIEHVSPAVVSVEVRTQVAAGGLSGLDPRDLPPGAQEFFEFFRRGLPEQPAPREGRGAGSGFFISPDGLVVTNNHVVADATRITVSLKDGRELEAEIVGTDEPTDLALLRVTGSDFPFVQFDADPRYRVGDWVVAVGNPFGLGGTATVGIISAIGREITGRGADGVSPSYNDFIQIDAPINRGNSGGPTFDLNGNVIGVNSQIYSPTGGNVGIGFAIPSDVAANIINQLAETGTVTRGWLGVMIEDVTEDLIEALGISGVESGAIVAQVTAGSPADDAGFQVGDIILAVDGAEVTGSTDLTRKVGSLRAGERYRFSINREGAERTLNVRLGARPSEQELRAGRSQERPRPAPEQPSDETIYGLMLSPLTSSVRQELELDNTVRGVAIVGVDPDSVAAARGLGRGVVIGRVNGEEVSTPQDVAAALDSARESGRTAAALLVHVGGGSRFVTLPLNEE